MSAKEIFKMDYKEFLKAAQDKALRLSFSSLSRLEKSPRHFVEGFLTEFKPTPAMVHGSLVHTLVLEPEQFADRYRIAPKINKRTNVGKAQWLEFVEESKGLEVVTEEQHAQALKSIEGLKKCKPAMALLRSATEVEEKLSFEYKGLTVRGLRDLAQSEFVCDLKTTADASPGAFRYSVRKFSYNMQAAIYTYQCGRPYYIIALEKNGNCAVYEMGQAQLAAGRAMFERLVVKFKQVSLLDAWQDSYNFGIGDGVHIID